MIPDAARSRPATDSPSTRAARNVDPWFWAVVALALLYAALFTGLAFQAHAAMRTHKADLGQIDQAIWNSSRGRFLEQTDNGYLATRLTDHVEPLLALISPVFWLWDDVRALLLLQALAVAAGAPLLYLLAMRLFDRALGPRRALIWEREPAQAATRPVAAALAVAYLLAPQLQSALLTEFHAAPLAVPLILWALWAVEARRWAQFAVAALLVSATKEEMALLGALLGLWAVWRSLLRRHASRFQPASAVAGGGLNPRLKGEKPVETGWRRELWGGPAVGLAVAVLSFAWFAAATFVIVPRHAVTVYGLAESGYFARYGALGDSPAGIFKSLLTQPRLVWHILTEPARLGYLWRLAAAFGLLPLLAPDVLLLVLPVLLANALSAYPAQYYGEFHYSAPVLPYVAAAAAFGAARIRRLVQRRITAASPAFQHMPASGAGTMAAAAFVRNARTSVPPLLSALLALWIVGWAAWGYAEGGRGPWGGRYDPTTVTAHHRLLARFTAQIPRDAPLTATAAVHPHVSHRRYVYQFPLGLDTPAPAEPATWALLDVTTNTDMAPGDLKARVEAMLADGWGVVDAADGFLLLNRGAPGTAIPDAFYDFARAGDAAFEPGFAGVEVDDWPRWRQTKVTVDWGADGAGAPPDAAIVGADGSTLHTFDGSAPALQWLPPEQWQAGETVEITTLPMPLPRSFALVSGGQVRAVYRRDADDRLVALPPDLAQTQDLGALLREELGLRGAAVRAEFAGELALAAWLDAEDVRPGASVDLWLQWSGAAWPDGATAFVHLRQAGENAAQADGLPRVFVTQDAAAQLAGAGFVNDWRSLTVPAGAAPGSEFHVVVGLYDAATGKRSPLAVGGDELRVGSVRVADAAPDQACALLPETCASAP